MSSSGSFVLLIMRSLRESGPMSVCSVTAHTLTVLCLRRVVVDRCCMLEDMFDRYFS